MFTPKKPEVSMTQEKHSTGSQPSLPGAYFPSLHQDHSDERGEELGLKEHGIQVTLAEDKRDLRLVQRRKMNL